MLDPYLSSEDKVWVVKFVEAVEEIINTSGIHADLNLFVIADTIGLDLSVLHKEGTLMYALWVALLNVLKDHLTPDDFKYKSCEEFLEEYPGWFLNESEKEKNWLWQTANWMQVLFKMITARKNKGLALSVIPKVVEGWDAKYVTGSGQTRATANRVHVFEVEGNTKANQRGKIRTKKKVVPGAKKERVNSASTHINVDENGEVVMKQPRKKRVLKPLYSSYAAPFDSSELGTRSREKRARDAINTIYEAALAADGAQDNTTSSSAGNNDSSSSISSDVEKAYYKLLRDSSCSSVLSFARDIDGPLFGSSGMPGINYDYSRNITNMSLGGLDPLNFISLSGPSDLQRGYSWTEIPVKGEEGGSTPHGLQSSSSGSGPNYDFDEFAGAASQLEGVASKTPQQGETLSEDVLADMFTGYIK